MVVGIGGTQIRPIDKAAIHRICSGQVVLDLATAVKELVENSLDAGATNIEIRLKEYGGVLIEVADNGSGVAPDNFQGLTLKYHTSKIYEFSDLQTLSSFGFRGEALSSLCALSNVTVTTRTKEEAVGARLLYDHSGVIISQENVARAVGTTVAISKLFSPLPVRYKEFTRNIRREYGHLLSILQAYAIIAKGVRLVCTNQVGKSGRTTIVQTQGSGSVKDNIITVFGSKTTTCLESLDLLVSDGCRVEGFVSRPGAGCGRASGDRQFFYVNGRPVDLPKINRLLNELYGSYNSLQKPMAFLNFILSPTAYDVNVTPDKRKVFLHMESDFLVALREALERVYAPDKYSYTVNNLETTPKQQNGIARIGEVASEISNMNPHQRVDDNSLGSPEESTDTEEENEGTENKKNEVNDSGRTASVLFHSEPPSTSGQEKKSTNGFLDLLSFKLKGAGAGAGAGAKGIVGGNLVTVAHPVSKALSVSRNVPKILQSRLTGFVLAKKKSCEEERDQPATIQPEPITEEVATIEPSPEESSPMETEDIPVVDMKQDKASCCGDHNEHEPAPAVLKRKLVIGLDQHEIGYSEHSGLGNASNMDMEEMLPPELEDEDVRSSFLKDRMEDEVLVECTPGVPIPPQGNATTLLFDLEKLRMKGKRGLLNCRDETAKQGKPLKRQRGFTAATLEADGMAKGGVEKEAALVAATKELERSFNKADFKLMKILIPTRSNVDTLSSFSEEYIGLLVGNVQHIFTCCKAIRKVIGQFNLGFILAKLEQDLFIVDQHASDEKYNFERLSKTTVLNKQPLISPLPVELSAAEEIIVTTHIETFRQNGFDFVEDETALPGRRLRLAAVPFSKNIMFGVGDVQELVGILANELAPVARASPGCTGNRLLSSLRPSRVRGMLASRACRSSIMIGDALSKKEMEKVLCHLTDLDAPWNCPHGRPTMRHLADLTALHR